MKKNVIRIASNRIPSDDLYIQLNFKTIQDCLNVSLVINNIQFDENIKTINLKALTFLRFLEHMLLNNNNGMSCC